MISLVVFFAWIAPIRCRNVVPALLVGGASMTTLHADEQAGQFVEPSALRMLLRVFVSPDRKLRDATRYHLELLQRQAGLIAAEASLPR
jgi:hypothetical protein